MKKYLLLLICFVCCSGCFPVRLIMHEAASRDIDYSEEEGAWGAIDRERLYTLTGRFCIVDGCLVARGDKMNNVTKVPNGAKLRFQQIVHPGPQYINTLKVKGTVMWSNHVFNNIILNEVCEIRKGASGKPIVSLKKTFVN